MVNNLKHMHYNFDYFNQYHAH